MCPTGRALENGTKFIQKSNLRSAFDVLDVDGDGKIGYGDLESFYGGFSDLDSPEKDVIGSMISIADLSNDGFVEYDEFEKVLIDKRTKKGNNGGFNDLMKDVFGVMDKDEDGKVGYEDLKSYFSWAGIEAHDEDVKAMIRLGGGGDENGGVTFEGLLKILAV